MQMLKFIIPIILLLIQKTVFGQIEVINPKSDFILEGDHFSPGSPWVIVGGGYGRNFSEKEYEPNFMFDFNYQLKDKNQVIGLGFLTSRDQFRDTMTSALILPHSYVRHSTNSLHATYGLRYENLRHHFSFAGGPAYNWGWRYTHTEYYVDTYLNDTIAEEFHRPYKDWGLYINIHYAYKIYYDIGIGASLWASYCENYQVAGITINLFLSTAFKRKVK